jgi:hypothetical protein
MTSPDARLPRGKKSRTSDRYNLINAAEPPGGVVGRAPRSPNAFTALVAVEDPIPDSQGRHGRVLATVNRRVDILELERSHRRISARAYTVGRIVQAVFERSRGSSASSQWGQGDRVDAEVAKELRIIRSIDNAHRVKEYVDSIRKAVGRIDANILQLVLGDGKTYADVAALRGRDGRQGTGYFAGRFRDALEDLASEWERKR